MHRRTFLRAAAAAGASALAGCAADGGKTSTGSPSDSETPVCPHVTTHEGPHAPYDTLSLHPMPDYVTEYPKTVVVEYQSLGAAARRAVERALASDDAYRECGGDGQTDVMALFSHVERRWAEVGREAFRHTYLHRDGVHYGITLVQEGDFIRINSIPCTEEACPTTPTPPS